MNSSKNLIFLLFLIFVCSSHQELSPGSPECVKILDNFGEQVKRVFFVDEIPRDLEKINFYCEMANKYSIEFKKHATYCLEPLARTTIGFVNRGVRKMIKNVCKGIERRIDVKKILNCSPKSASPQLRKCMYATHLQIEFLVRNQTYENVFGDFCCVQKSLTQCLNQINIYPECENSPNNTRSFFINMLNILTKESYEISCANFKTIQDCKRGSYNRLELLRKVGNSNKKIEGHILITPLLNLLDKMIS